jgi:hypothetical protein
MLQYIKGDFTNIAACVSNLSTTVSAMIVSVLISDCSRTRDRLCGLVDSFWL